MKSRLEIYPRTARQRPGKTCVDLFAGAGGLAEGFRQAGWSILAANDADRDACTTFRTNFPESAVFAGPISSLAASVILKHCKIRVGQLDCLIGGPPCQSFSYNNHHRSAEDERSLLFRHYLRLVRGLRPKTLVMENVPGILTVGDNRVIGEISRKLKKLGYDVSIRVLSAEEFGVPQVRRRVFIVASRVGAASEMLPNSTHASAEGTRRPPNSPDYKLVRKGRPKPVTVLQAIGDLPRLRSGGGKHLAPLPTRKPLTTYQLISRKGAKGLHNHICNGLSAFMLRRIKHVPEGGNWRNIPFSMLPAGMQRAKKNDHTKRYGRLSRNAQASTILTKCDPHWGAYIHPTQNRTISVREAARLQGFPDVFAFAGESLSKQYMQVGNAVPIPLAKAIGKAAIRHARSKTK